MSGYVPEFIQKGQPVMYKGKETLVLDHHFTCPCAIGEYDHHPTDDLLMVNLEGIGATPYSFKDFKKVKTKKEKKKK